MDHYTFPPHPLFGGSPGAPSALVVGPDTDSEKVYHQISGVQVPEGTVVSHRTAGGGGYGNPFERDPHAVGDEVRNGLISIETARDEYGVVVDPDGLSLDLAETISLREKR
jgi:N-methylhydantoinase B